MQEKSDRSGGATTTTTIRRPEVSDWVSEEMAANVGEPYQTMVSYPVTESDIRRYAAAVYYPELPPRLYWDHDYAATTRYGGIVAPETFNPFAGWTAQPRPDEDTPVFLDPETGAGIEPPDYRAILVGETAVTYTDVRIRPGDTITQQAWIAAYTEREGRFGNQLYTTVAWGNTNQADETVRTVEVVFVRYR